MATPDATAASAPHPSGLHAALEKLQGLSGQYPSGDLLLSNHLPMALHALDALGGAPAYLQRLLRGRRQHLVAASADERTQVAHWQAVLAQDGVLATLHTVLPQLLDAPETQAFHGLIRLAHAVLGEHRGELAHALANWHLSRQTLGTPPTLLATPSGQASLRAALAAAQEDSALAWVNAGRSTISNDLLQCAALPGFDAFVVGRQAPDDKAISTPSLAEASLAVYLATHNFTALHLVTGLHAWRTLTTSPALLCAATPAQQRGLWRAWFAAWLSIGRPTPAWDAVRNGRASEACWHAALPELLTSNHEHHLKLAWTSREEWRHHGWPGYARLLASP